MVPMARTNANLLSLDSNENVNTDEDPLTSIAKPDLIQGGHLHETHKAVIQEVEIFKRRENLLEKFMAILWIHFLATLMAFSTYFWYSGFWSGALMLFGLHYCPTYSRSAGFVGRNNISNNHYLTFFGVGSFLNCIASTAMSVYLILEIQSFSCGEMENTCTRAKEVLTWSVVLYVGQALFLLASLNLDLLLFKNFHYEVGDIIVDKLVQSRDLEKVLRSAKLGGIKERRNAAFEMVGLIASNIETKMTVVNEGGLQVLINLALSTDSATQEYATEAIAEMLTVPEIQGHFVDVGGIRTLSALLQSNDMRVVTEAVTAMSYIVAYNEANKLAFIAENGLNDLSHVSTKVSAPLSRIVAGMFLELAFSSEIRYVMSLDKSSVQALLSLSKVEDRETLRLSLQTLELLAIENPASILDNSTLLLHLLSMAKLEEDEQLYLLAGKIMLYYASDENGCKS
ncbi:uncharacterized protein LOC124444401 isoform X2 [Xenia sp. Carnegie-2017]|nr:uncharacterized protein LOC124444401 isoform X2 [Xenia sp. Carnegie-2017]